MDPLLRLLADKSRMLPLQVASLNPQGRLPLPRRRVLQLRMEASPRTSWLDSETRLLHSRC